MNRMTCFSVQERVDVFCVWDKQTAKGGRNIFGVPSLKSGASSNRMRRRPGATYPPRSRIRLTFALSALMTDERGQ